MDFGQHTLADDRLNHENLGKVDGFVKEGNGTMLANYRKDFPVKLNTIVEGMNWAG